MNSFMNNKVIDMIIAYINLFFIN